MKETLQNSQEESSANEEEQLTTEQLEILWQLEKPLNKILKQLRRDIDKGSYAFILGDDASGRIPTLIIGEVLKEVYRDKGLKLPLVRFVAGSTGLHQRDQEKKRTEVIKQVGRIQDDVSREDFKGAKALIVTDTITSGQSVSMLLDAMGENKVDADVATIGISGTALRGGKKKLERKYKTKIVYGMEETPQIYPWGEKGLAGVIKKPEYLFSKPTKQFIKNSTNKEIEQLEINAVRAVVHQIAQKIIKKYQKR